MVTARWSVLELQTQGLESLQIELERLPPSPPPRQRMCSFRKLFGQWVTAMRDAKATILLGEES